MARTPGGLPLLELAVEEDDFATDLVAGLSARPRAIPCKYFYDQRGSELFEAITELEEYYPTRTEIAIMRQHGAEMGEALGPDGVLIEYGSGSSAKIRLLLDHLREPRAYVPIDISREHLMAAADALAEAYPGLAVAPVWADYTRPFELPASLLTGRRRAVYFPGSTIGNFGPVEARAFLRRIGAVVGRGGGFLVGVDLKKDKARLDRAYDDAQGVTAEFNLNLLVRANRELGANFDVGRFRHLGYYAPEASRIEIYLVSVATQEVTVNGARFAFAEGERVLTEYSYKYSFADFEELAADAGFAVERVWTDPERLFSVQYLRRE
jgi:dimethylhistidine N-methyltransferase